MAIKNVFWKNILKHRKANKSFKVQIAFGTPIKNLISSYYWFEGSKFILIKFNLSIWQAFFKYFSAGISNQIKFIQKIVHETFNDIFYQFWTFSRPISMTRIGAQCYEYTGRSDALFLFVYRAPKEDSHFQTQLANNLNHSICHKLQYKLDWVFNHHHLFW